MKGKHSAQWTAVVGIAALVASFVASGMSVAPRPPSYAWSPARVDGGGFVTVVAPSPKTTNLWLAGSDVAGVFRSTDGGKTWSGAKKGFEDRDERKVGAIEWDPFNSARAWACVGAIRAGVPVGAVVRTNDGGLTWTTISRQAFCTGGVNPLAGVSTPHPRSTGRLLIADPSRPDTLWIGTVIAGVMRSTDGGMTWTPQGLSGLPIRGMAVDPLNPDVMFVAVRSATTGEGGVYRTTNANASSPVWEHLSGPVVAEELAIIGGRLYVAAGNQGVWSADLTAPALQLIHVGQSTLPVNVATDVMTITGARIGDVDTVIAGVDADAVCTTSPTWCPSIYRSVDRGVTWTPVPIGPDGVHLQIGDPAGTVWRQSEWPDTVLGGTSYVASDVRVDPFAASHLLVAGRAGIWRSTDGGANWFPVPKGLTVTFHGQPATDAAQPGSAVVPTSDWNLLGTVNDGGSVQGIPFPAEGGTSARLMSYVGSGSAPLYVGVGFGASNSELYVQETAGAGFVPLGFGSASHASGVLAVAARDVGGQRVVVAVGRRAGVWRKAGVGPWIQVATAPGGVDGATSPRTARLAWAPDGALYASDRGDVGSTGVWRSLDSGVTWVQITPSIMDIAIDPASTHRLWLAGGGEVWRVDDARSGTTTAGSLVISQRTALASARLITTDPAGGVIVVTSQVVSAALGQPGAHGAVFRSTTSGASFKKVSTDAVSPGLVDPVGIAVGPNGAVHIATSGFGWWVGRPA